MRDRDEASHNAWAAAILHKAIVGTEAAHPELIAFRNGFKLPCRNGFNFFDVCTIWLFLNLSRALIRLFPGYQILGWRV